MNCDVFDCNFVFHRTILFFYFQEYTCQISAYTPTDLTHSVKIRGDYLYLYEDDDWNEEDNLKRSGKMKTL